jgi:hypothetical protein
MTACAGKAVWDKRYAPRKAVNCGIGGDSTRQLLWRIRHGEVGIAAGAAFLRKRE